MMLTLQWLIVVSCLDSSDAASIGEVVPHSYSNTCWYLLFVGGVVSCGMLLVPVCLAWLTSHLGTIIRGVSWVVSPIISKNVEGFVEVGGRLLRGFQFVGSTTLQKLYFVDTAITSVSSSTKFNYPTLLVWLCTIGLLFASLPSSTSILHALYVVLILQVWIKLPTSFIPRIGKTFRQKIAPWGPGL
jgi:hypothetical protein